MIGSYRSTGSNIGSKIRRVASARTRMEHGKKVLDYKDKQIRSRTKERQTGEKQVSRIKKVHRQLEEKAKLDRRKGEVKEEIKLVKARGAQQRAGYKQQERINQRERKAKIQYYREKKEISSGGDDK